MGAYSPVVGVLEGVFDRAGLLARDAAVEAVLEALDGVLTRAGAEDVGLEAAGFRVGVLDATEPPVCWAVSDWADVFGVTVLEGRGAAAVGAEPLNDDGAAFAGALCAVVAAAGFAGGFVVAGGCLAVPGGFAVVGVFPRADLAGALADAPEAADTVRLLDLRRTPGLGVSGSTFSLSDAVSSSAGFWAAFVVSTGVMVGLAPFGELEAESTLEDEADWETGGDWTGVPVPLGGVAALGVSMVSSLTSFATLSPGDPPAPFEFVFDSELATDDESVFTLGLRYEGITNPGLDPGSCGVVCCALGGHSLFSLVSAVDASPTELVWDTTLELREPPR